MAKLIALYHNPQAGDSDHGKEYLLGIIKNAGYDCIYISVKEKNWQYIPDGTDWIGVAGGDGTVRKMVAFMDTQPAAAKKIPIGILPMGTANNIAKTLGSTGDPEVLVKSWGKKSTAFDTAVVKSGEKRWIMAEGAGAGLFPSHIINMRNRKGGNETAAEKLQTDRNILINSIASYQPFEAWVEMDGMEYNGSFLMIEVMNVKSVGSNIGFVPDAEVSDGLLNIVLIPGDRKKELTSFLQKEDPNFRRLLFDRALQGKNVRIKASIPHFHIDDEVAHIPNDETFEIAVGEKQLRFFSY
ncbi:MAG: diacylglycerol/lipid kinase family protein [Agriterribacter sp.]